MRQTRISIGCQDWQKLTESIGAEAAGVYLYLRTLMRRIQTAEITITLSELAQAVKLPSDEAESALRAICVRYLARENNPDGSITLRSPVEAAAQADMFRKRAARALANSQRAIQAVSGQFGSASPARQQSAAPRADGQSGQSGVNDGNSEKLNSKNLHTDFFMIYSGSSAEKEKAPRTPEKEKTLTEFTGRAPDPTPAPASAPVREAELPVDKLEADYIDVCGSWPQSLREAVRGESDDVREAFYLFVRQKRTEDPVRWGIDRVRIAFLAARRIPPERRAESILAAAMAGWKTIRDCGSGCYFEKETGRIVSLVRGTVERSPQADAQQSNAELALKLARSMRRD